jgi:dTDP-4-dehydrorhamnose reductase
VKASDPPRDPQADWTQINAGVPAHLAKLSREKGFVLFYISTDYVFNGRK